MKEKQTKKAIKYSLIRTKTNEFKNFTIIRKKLERVNDVFNKTQIAKFYTVAIAPIKKCDIKEMRFQIIEYYNTKFKYIDSIAYIEDIIRG